MQRFLPGTSIWHSCSTIRTCAGQDFAPSADRLDPEEKRVEDYVKGINVRYDLRILSLYFDQTQIVVRFRVIVVMHQC